MYALLVLAAITASAPQASPTPLHEIARVRATVLCTALQSNVHTALLRIVEGDAAIARGRSRFAQMARDEVLRARGSLRFDQIAVDTIVRQIASSMQAAHEQLDDEKRIPHSANTTEERTLTAIKHSLEATLSDQNDAVNVLNGTVETDRLGRMQKEGLDALQGAVNNDFAQAPSITSGLAEDDEITSYLGYAGIDPLTAQTGNTLSFAPDGMVSDTIYDQMSLVIALTQSRAARHAAEAEELIRTLWPSCVVPPALQPPATTLPASKPSP
jgi:hypothetical protein